MIKKNNATPPSDEKPLPNNKSYGLGARVGRRRPARPKLKSLSRLTKSAMI